MKRARVTSRHVAERAGVSLTTVSFVLNGVEGAGIGAATRERVLAAARDLGYVPSAAARSLVSGRTHTLGLIISHAEHLVVDAYIPQVLYAMNQVSRAHGFRVLVEAVEDVTRPDAYLELVRARQIDGLLVLNPRRDDRQLPELIRDGFPVVTLGVLPGADPYAVAADNVDAARRAVRHLVGLGRRRIGHVPFSPLEYSTTDHRLLGWRAELEASGLEAGDDLVAYGSYSSASGAAATRGLLERRPDLDAIFCGNDTMALGALSTLYAAGRRVPDDVAVVGHDDIPIAGQMVPPLTTIRSPAVEQGRAAMEMLVRVVGGGRPEPRLVVLDTPLIVRRSCGARGPAADPDPTPEPVPEPEPEDPA